LATVTTGPNHHHFEGRGETGYGASELGQGEKRRKKRERTGSKATILILGNGQ